MVSSSDRDRPIHRPRRPRLLVDDLAQQRLAVGPSKIGSSVSSSYRVAPRRVDVGAMVHQDAPAGGLLRAHVAQGADHVAGLRQAGVGGHCARPKSVTQRLPLAVEQQVGRLDVAMDDARPRGRTPGRRPPAAPSRAAVRKTLPAAAGAPARAESAIDRLAVGPRGEIGRDRSPGERGGWPRRAQLADHRGEGPAVDELHGVEVDAALAADRVDGHDVGVVQLGGGLGLVLEALQVLGVQRRGERQHLQRDAPAQGQLHGLVDDAHAAAADLADDLEIAQRCRSGLRRCGGRRPQRPAGGVGHSTPSKHSASAAAAPGAGAGTPGGPVCRPASSSARYSRAACNTRGSSLPRT